MSMNGEQIRHIPTGMVGVVVHDYGEPCSDCCENDRCLELLLDGEPSGRAANIDEVEPI